MELEHYFKRAEMWFDFLMRHPEKRTKHIILKLYRRYMLVGVTCHVLLQNTNA